MARRRGGQLAWLEVTGCDDALDDTLADTRLDERWLVDDEPVDVEGVVVVAVLVAAGPTAMAATRPVNATADTPTVTRRARAAGWRRGPAAPARGGRRRELGGVDGSGRSVITGDDPPGGYEPDESRRRIR